MNLSPIARGINALCLQLASTRPPTPVSRLDVDYAQELIDQHWPTPRTFDDYLWEGVKAAVGVPPARRKAAPAPAPTRWITRAEAQATFKPEQDLHGSIGYLQEAARLMDAQRPPSGWPFSIGIDWGSKQGDLTGWWAKVNGRPFFWPDHVDLDTLREVFGQAEPMPYAAVRMWFDEEDARVRAEAVDMREWIIPPEVADGSIGTAAVQRSYTLFDVLQAAEACKGLEGEPVKPLRVTRADFERLNGMAHAYRASGKLAGLSTLAGVPVEIVPDDDPMRWIPPHPVPLNPGN